MPIGNFLKSTCRYCHQKAGILQRDHPDCQRSFHSGWQEIVELAAQAARSRQFDEKSLRISMAAVAQRSFGDGSTVNQALEEGWKQGVDHAMANEIMSQVEEAGLTAVDNIVYNS